MKISLLSCSIFAALTFAASSAYADNTVENNTLYLGAKTGWTNFDSNCQSGESCDNDAWGGSGLVGYQISNWLAIEGGYNYFGNDKHTGSSKYDKVKSQNVELSFKGDWYLSDNWNLFGKIGGSYNDVKLPDADNVSLMLGTGIEYHISQSVRLRAEYQWFDNIGEYDHYKSRGDVNYVTFGIIYMFGQDAYKEPVLAAPISMEQIEQDQVGDYKDVAAPVQVEKNDTSMTLVTVNFAEKSDEISLDSYVTLQTVVDQLNAHPEQTVTITGYTSNSANSIAEQKVLSKQRAKNTAEYLESHGIASDRIMTEGMRAKSPVADNSTEEGRAKNRRVEIIFQ
ncbi:OmpA family protein [Vibrio sp. S11_S32]|uniref:OmpA family protein n=1 Tax=Vibrio sp. S11_S32 TaxID=2720225 RepID=UPI001680BF6D|nr:OmpA family protein [Vibrio sp. S11_S32]MBD1577462.1 OmpA family protein [Vibrio sp. S11_S32]